MFAGSLLFAIQIYNIFCRNPNRFTFRNILRNVKMQRFAADGVCQVLYYEGRSPFGPVGRKGGGQYLGQPSRLILSMTAGSRTEV